MDKKRVILITGTRKGIGNYLSQYYAGKGDLVIGCSRRPVESQFPNYHHFSLDVSDEKCVKELFVELYKAYHHLDILINNAGIASMNHTLLTPLATVRKIFETNYFGTFLFCREAAKLMRKNNFGRIVNFTTVAVPLQLEGEAVYASSKSAIETLTRVLARELGADNIIVNAIGPTPVKTDLLNSVSEKKLAALIQRQAIKRYGEPRDISNMIDFFLRPESDFVTGQVIYLGGI